MKTFVCFILLVLLFGTVSITFADTKETEAMCPADQAAAAGNTLFQQLHHVIAPAWHEAYPDKNYAGLGDAMVKLDALIPDVKALNHGFKLQARKDEFNAAREKFVTLVEQGVMAKADGANETIYNLTPQIHEYFEEMAACLLPLDFPEFTSLATVVDLMVNTHLKNQDYDAVKSSLEALQIKQDMLANAELPEAMKPVSKTVEAELAVIDNRCKDLAGACEENDHKKMEDSLIKLAMACKKFENLYL